MESSSLDIGNATCTSLLVCNCKNTLIKLKFSAFYKEKKISNRVLSIFFDWVEHETSGNKLFFFLNSSQVIISRKKIKSKKISVILVWNSESQCSKYQKQPRQTSQTLIFKVILLCWKLVESFLFFFLWRILVQKTNVFIKFFWNFLFLKYFIF